MIINNRNYKLADRKDSLFEGLIKRGHLLEISPNEFEWTKKHALNVLLNLSKILPLNEKIECYKKIYKIWRYC